MAYRKDYEELTVITKTYDLILWSCNHTGKFPKNHRFVLGERIERNHYDLLETLIQAKYPATLPGLGPDAVRPDLPVVERWRRTHCYRAPRRRRTSAVS
jgi:hypothetical protein